MTSRLQLMRHLQIGSLNGQPIYRSPGSEDKEWLIHQIFHRKSRVRWQVACEIGKLQIVEAIDPLISALNDPQWLVRLHAAQALGRIGDKRALEPLKQRLEDPCLSVRQRVIVALGHMKDERIIPLILKEVQIERKVWPYAIKSLKNVIGYPAADLLTFAARYGKRRWYSGRLVKIGGFLTPILRIVLKIPAFQKSAISLLGVLGNESASKDLLEIYTLYRNPPISWRAGNAYGQIQCRKYEKYLDM